MTRKEERYKTVNVQTQDFVVTVCSQDFSLSHDPGIVTRCPLELKLKRTNIGKEWYGKIRYQNQEEVIQDAGDVEKKIREGTAHVICTCHW